MKYFSLFLLVVSLLFSSVKTALANDYIYLSQNPVLHEHDDVGYYSTWAYWGWFQDTNRNPLYYDNSINGADAYIAGAINQWIGLSGTPSWMAIVGDPAKSDLEFTTTNLCFPGNKACFADQVFTLDAARTTATWTSAKISYPDYSVDSPGIRQYIFTHELGHVLGLHDLYGNSSHCNGPNDTVMTDSNCSNFSLVPTSWDSDNLRNYWKGCDGLYSWCATMHPYNSPNLSWNGSQPTSTWENHSWLNYTSVIFYYAAPHWSGPYTKRWTKNQYFSNIGFWEDAVLGSHAVSTDTAPSWVNWSSGEWIVVCNKPWIWYGIEGYWTCSNNAVQVP